LYSTVDIVDKVFYATKLIAFFAVKDTFSEKLVELVFQNKLYQIIILKKILKMIKFEFNIIMYADV